MEQKMFSQSQVRCRRPLLVAGDCDAEGNVVKRHVFPKNCRLSNMCWNGTTTATEPDWFCLHPIKVESKRPGSVCVLSDVYGVKSSNNVSNFRVRKYLSHSRADKTIRWSAARTDRNRRVRMKTAVIVGLIWWAAEYRWATTEVVR